VSTLALIVMLIILIVFIKKRRAGELSLKNQRRAHRGQSDSSKFQMTGISSSVGGYAEPASEPRRLTFVSQRTEVNSKRSSSSNVDEQAVLDSGQPSYNHLVPAKQQARSREPRAVTTFEPEQQQPSYNHLVPTLNADLNASTKSGSSTTQPDHKIAVVTARDINAYEAPLTAAFRIPTNDSNELVGVLSGTGMSIQRKHVELNSKIGTGSFGDVYKATLRIPTAKPQ
jgi:hypothetical protein